MGLRQSLYTSGTANYLRLLTAYQGSSSTYRLYRLLMSLFDYRVREFPTTLDDSSSRLNGSEFGGGSYVADSKVSLLNALQNDDKQLPMPRACCST